MKLLGTIGAAALLAATAAVPAEAQPGWHHWRGGPGYRYGPHWRGPRWYGRPGPHYGYYRWRSGYYRRCHYWGNPYGRRWRCV